ncbi:hypothetical protein A2U01_0053642, partial [Trifolium medium]|nr:hypothetical protein [Trifolium medium]
ILTDDMLDIRTLYLWLTTADYMTCRRSLLSTQGTKVSDLLSRLGRVHEILPGLMGVDRVLLPYAANTP